LHDHQEVTFTFFDNGAVQILFAFRNFGKTPAFDVIIAQKFQIVGSSDEFCRVISDIDIQVAAQKGGIVAPGEIIFQETWVSPSQADALTSMSARICYAVEIRYSEDPDGVKRRVSKLAFSHIVNQRGNREWGATAYIIDGNEIS
jgi:hypothetical protein